MRGTRVEIGHRSQIVLLYELIECYRGDGAAFNFFWCAVGLNIEDIEEKRDSSFDLGRGYGLAKRCEFVDFQHLYVAAECSALQSQIGVDVEHTAVVVAHKAKAVMLQRV